MTGVYKIIPGCELLETVRLVGIMSWPRSLGAGGSHLFQEAVEDALIKINHLSTRWQA
jgi:hypothetical protein